MNANRERWVVRGLTVLSVSCVLVGVVSIVYAVQVWRQG